MEDNSFTRRMRKFYPNKEILEILYKSGDHGVLCACVVDYERQDVLNTIIGPKKLLIKEETVSIMFTYPLTNKASFEYTNKGGFTRLDLFRCIYEGYRKIYEIEEKDAGDPETYENLYNRKTSQGRYGIWGHYITDLRIEGITYDPKTKLLELMIGS